MYDVIVYKIPAIWGCPRCF